MPILMDAHEDLAWNMFAYGRDYRRSALEIRQLEHDSDNPEKGQALLGWPEYQRGQVAVVFATLFAAPRHHSAGEAENLVYDNYDQAHQLYMNQLDFYHRWCEENPDMFRLVTDRRALDQLLKPWDETPAAYPGTTHPVGLVVLMEGADGVRSVGELEQWRQKGLSHIGLAWMGSRYCGATRQTGGFTREGLALLDGMAALGFTLDIAHMNMESAVQALDVYQGPVICSHANVRRLVKGNHTDWAERHLSDDALRLLIERDGILGLVPFNLFLDAGWTPEMGKDRLTLADHFAAHIDSVCQMAGDARHVGLGTDYDGGFGAQSTPGEVDTIADLQQLGTILAKRGYTEKDVNAILGGNWRRHLEEHLPRA